VATLASRENHRELLDDEDIKTRCIVIALKWLQ